MIFRILTLLGFFGLSLTANAEANCTKSLSISPSSVEAGKFSVGSSSCINNEFVSQSFYPALDAESAYRSLNKLCNTPVRCSAQTIWNYSLVGQFVSSSVSGNLTTVKLQSAMSDPCGGTYTTISQLVLDNSLQENASFLAANPPAGQWLSVSLQCTSQYVYTYSSTGSTSYYGGGTYTNTYSNCVVKSAVQTAAPAQSKYCL